MASIAEPSSMAASVDYPSGARALRFAADGTGFAYYPSGKIAACVSDANDDTPARVHFFYADGHARRLLGFVNETANGFACSPGLGREFRWNEKYGDLLQGNTSAGLDSIAAPTAVLGASPRAWAKYDINGRRLRRSGGGGSTTRGSSTTSFAAGAAADSDTTFASATASLADVDRSAAAGLGAGVGDGLTVKRWTWGKPTEIDAARDLEMKLNESLSFGFVSRQHIEVRFSCDGVRTEFQCGLVVRREISYLDDPRTTRIAMGPNRGRLQLHLDAPTLVERLAEGFAASAARRSFVKPSSKDVANSEVAAIMSALEEHFAPYEEKIRDQTWVSTSCGLGWREEALERTRSEVPTVVATHGADGKATEVAISRKLVAGGGHDASMELSLVTGEGVASQLGKTWQRRDGKMMTALEVATELRSTNPVYPRGAMIRGASGRYSLDCEVERRPTRMKSLTLLSSTTFDRYLAEEVGPDELLLVACMREDDHSSGHAAQLLQMLNGELSSALSRAGTPKGTPKASSSSTPAGAGATGGSTDTAAAAAVALSAAAQAATKSGASEGSSLTSFKLAKFEMAESRFMVERYGVLTLPCFLMFYQGRPVYAGSMGGKRERLERETATPRVLVVEPNFQEQISVEKLLRAQRPPVLWDLALTASEARLRQKQLSESLRLSSRKTRDVNSAYGIVLLGSALSDADCTAVMQTVTNAAAPSDPHPVFVALALRSDVAPARRPRTNAVRDALATASRKGGRPRKTVADPRTGCVCFPTPALLRGGKATLAVLNPLRVAGLHAVTSLWREQTMVEGGLGHHVEARTVGLTRKRLLEQMRTSLERGRRGQFLTEAATRRGSSALSVQDATVRVTLGGTPS